ncbi:hypothetical protein [Glycomyces albidus]|uniref:Uncharacterized protein n=1 Tax=Glycomyces albidus TaxID=2656774 RepID=A0A6L5G7L9_9ACTN|nr:hypothetical protein [Glycomyces albidus]MQM25645.1 hypothetical protein [Glycomyces albidus]
MNAAITPAKPPGTLAEQMHEKDWRDDGPGDDHGERSLLRSVLPFLAGSVAVGIAVVALIGVELNRRRRSKSFLGRVVARAEDAKDALAHAAAGMPDRGKAAARRLWR